MTLDFLQIDEVIMQIIPCPDHPDCKHFRLSPTSLQDLLKRDDRFLLMRRSERKILFAKLQNSPHPLQVLHQSQFGFEFKIRTLQDLLSDAVLSYVFLIVIHSALSLLTQLWISSFEIHSSAGIVFRGAVSAIPSAWPGAACLAFPEAAGGRHGADSGADHA
jgi:hypothetical protein